MAMMMGQKGGALLFKWPSHRCSKYSTRFVASHWVDIGKRKIAAYRRHSRLHWSGERGKVYAIAAVQFRPRELREVSPGVEGRRVQL